MRISAYKDLSVSPEQIFRALGDETRLRCVMLMQTQGELCVCELTHALQLAQPKISRHLASLRAASVLQDRREGVWIYYQVSTQLPAWAQAMLQQTATGLATQAPYIDDVQRLQQMANRPNGGACAS